MTTPLSRLIECAESTFGLKRFALDDGLDTPAMRRIGSNATLSFSAGNENPPASPVNWPTTPSASMLSSAGRTTTGSVPQKSSSMARMLSSAAMLECRRLRRLCGWHRCRCTPSDSSMSSPTRLELRIGGTTVRTLLVAGDRALNTLGTFSTSVDVSALVGHEYRLEPESGAPELLAHETSVALLPVLSPDSCLLCIPSPTPAPCIFHPHASNAAPKLCQLPGS